VSTANPIEVEGAELAWSSERAADLIEQLAARAQP
jgi:hypothetical protein